MARRSGLLFAAALALALGFVYRPAAAGLGAEPSWEEARALLKQGKPGEAKAAFESLVRKYRDEPDLYLFLALTELRLRNPQAAETQVRRALKLAPEHAEARTLLGWIELEVHHDYDAAIAEYSRVVQLRPEFPEGHNNLGAAWLKKGDLAKARESFDRALAIRADYTEALSNRGWTYVKEKDWRRARADFEKALAIDAGHEGALYGLSQVLRETRNYSGAQEALAKLTERSFNFVYWLERGEIQLLRYYWVLILVAVALFVRAKYKNGLRGILHGR
ncbi:MAG TPA: tetratricopeptide repeat protein [Candidatus Acidoferrales bacterium]|nr:tetratricopeptide repeat protein [Candidatus Acidoferrales bacterium]